MKDAIARTGDKITVPATISLPEAVNVLRNQIEYENKEVSISETLNGCYWDGARAFYIAMTEKFGWVHGQIDRGMWGEKIYPEFTSIPSGVNSTELVPSGKFQVPGIEGVLQTSYNKDHRGVVRFVINAVVKRRHEEDIRDLADRARKILATRSLYRGKAIRVRFTNDGRDIPLMQPEFMDVSGATESALVLPDKIHDAVHTSVFTPIKSTEMCRKHGIPLKRGVLLAGLYGTGKTMTAYVAANLAEKHGWTFLYCERAEELSDTVRFAMQYQPAIIFCEDIDQVLSGDRSVDMNDILNIIDGIESKGMEIMTVLTTNALESINPAMLRPGRLDAVINFTAPDAVAAARLVRQYARDTMDHDTDLTAAGEILAGKIPAVIRECVERAKLSQIKLGVGEHMKITGEAVADAASQMTLQLDLLNRKDEAPSANEALGAALRSVVTEAVTEANS
ncbi:MAG: ATP-binding protein [Hyphomicrobiaceae bacterium]|nr:MAG: ATP-binding protein [Hyphomicrobiaceae bacterium]